MLERLELDEAAHEVLVAHCRSQGIEFLSTPFDHESLDMLVNRFDLSTIKLSSGEVTNAPLLLRAARHARPLILSTGMATLEEVKAALGVLAFGYTQAGDCPAVEQFVAAGRSAEGQAALREHVTLLHCTTEYPAPFADVNLRAMETMRTAFGLEVGYSDHTVGISVAIAAVALGATVIEKHFTLDRTLPGPDHQASLEPDELRCMVQSIREVESALGGPLKAPAPSELKNRAIVRKSLVATCGIRRGEAFGEGNLGIKRPGGGVSPFRYWEYLGKVAGRDYSPDEAID
jgi:N-acetylneuraminate synthase